MSLFEPPKFKEKKPIVKIDIKIPKILKQTNIAGYKAILQGWVHKTNPEALNYPIYEKALSEYKRLTGKDFIMLHINGSEEHNVKKCTNTKCYWRR